MNAAEISFLRGSKHFTDWDVVRNEFGAFVQRKVLVRLKRTEDYKNPRGTVRHLLTTE
jgi:hypothetical protein